MDNFKSLMQRAETLRRLDSDPLRADWWAGYIRGLRRGHYGEQFGSQDEHDRLIAAVASDDPSRAALGRSYRAGLELKVESPD